ncbi:MAG: S-layer family protein, partial [Symploca sp. SIO2C1]|nr:S-layer family protein [Symploca sp. SIO2C1]
FRERLTPLSDITATSELGVEFNGEVQIDIQGIDPVQGLAELPETFADSSNQIAQTCSSQPRENSFVVTGRGGLPPTPDEALNPTPGWIDWRISGSRGDGEIRESEKITNHQLPLQDSNSNIQNPFVEATGWVKDTNGIVRLVAAPSLAVSSNKYFPQNCRANSFPVKE